MPVVALVTLCLFQVAAAVYTTHATNQAVRDGARALSLGQSATTAIDRSLPGALNAHRVTYTSGGEGVRLEVLVGDGQVADVAHEAGVPLIVEPRLTSTASTRRGVEAR